MPVHPRWRGERFRADAASFQAPWFIPAGAGNASSCHAPARPAAVHPRWRGERSHQQKQRVHYGGSSPLARGTRRCGQGQDRPNRFIPAGAGNAGYRTYWSARCSVHPRWRGERFLLALPERVGGGSSPLARGTPLDSHQTAGSCRFIPAGAGNAHFVKCAHRVAPVHPRWRGERCHRSQAAQAAGGSSPLARGTRRPRTLSDDLARFIPAGAGNAFDQPGRHLELSVHPRWRGERIRRGWRNRPGERFIPAGAGNASVARATMRRPAVHPRWRGERVASA